MGDQCACSSARGAPAGWGPDTDRFQSRGLKSRLAFVLGKGASQQPRSYRAATAGSATHRVGARRSASTRKLRRRCCCCELLPTPMQAPPAVARAFKQRSTKGGAVDYCQRHCVTGRRG
jgi:hypothetical protein